MKHTIMICDRDRQYAEKAAGYINSKDGFPFDVRVSDSLTEVKNVRKGMSIDIVLIDEDMLEKIGVRIRSRVSFKNIIFQKASGVVALSCGPGSYGIMYLEEGEHPYNLE